MATFHTGGEPRVAQMPALVALAALAVGGALAAWELLRRR